MPATTALIFEPLGLLSPAIIAYKIFLQNLWQDKLQCDELLPAHLQQEIHKQLQKSQGKQAINYPLHTRSWSGSNLLCEDSTTNFLCTRSKNLKEQQEVSASISLKTLHSSIDKEVPLRLGGSLQKSTLHYLTMHQMILPSNHHFT